MKNIDKLKELRKVENGYQLYPNERCDEHNSSLIYSEQDFQDIIIDEMCTNQFGLTKYEHCDNCDCYDCWHDEYIENN